MPKLKSICRLLVVLFLLSVIFISNVGQIFAQEEGRGWLFGVGEINKLYESNSTNLYTHQLPGPCYQQTISVVRNIFGRVFPSSESHCMRQIPGGAIDDRMTVYQPHGEKAYPLITNAKTIYPTNDMSALVYIGNGLGYYRDIVDSFKFNNDLLNPTFNLGEPDSYFKYSDGHKMLFNQYETLSVSDSGDYAVIEDLYNGYERINLSDLSMTRYAPLTPHNSANINQGGWTAISPSGHYAAISYNGGWGPRFFGIYDVDSCSDFGHGYDGSLASCHSRNLLPEMLQKFPDINYIGNLNFSSNNSINFVASSIKDGETTYSSYSMSAAGVPARAEQYLALGDSFASGEGAYDYRNGTDTDLNKCHQSLYSYPYILGSSQNSIESVACSGAKMNNLSSVSNQRTNQLQNDSKEIFDTRMDHMPGYALQNLYIGKDNPRIVTISIGGNDVGFSKILMQCILPFNLVLGDGIQNVSTSQNCYETYEDRAELVNTINDQFENLVDTYNRLKTSDPTRRVYVIGYPQLLSSTGSCGVNVRLSDQDRKFATETVDYLDLVIKDAAAKAGVFYVDTRDAFDGHKLCEAGDKAVNGLTAGDDNGFLGNESYHPNQLGHQLFAKVIDEQTDNLTAPMPARQDVWLPDTTDIELLKNAPRTGRVMYEIENGAEDIVHLSKGNIGVLPEWLTKRFMPDSSFDVVIHSDPENIGTLHTDAGGQLVGNLNIPSDLLAGIHTIHIYGKNIFGDPVDLQTTVYVEASADDVDGDGILNKVDSCIGVPNSGQDANKDGIDDACDSHITEPPADTAKVPEESSGQTFTGSQNDSSVTTTAQSFAISAGNQSGLQPASSSQPLSQKSMVLGLTAKAKPISDHGKSNKTEITKKDFPKASLIWLALVLAGIATLVYSWRRHKASN